MSAPTLVGASAGSGKTHRLTHEVTRAIERDAEAPVRLEGLVAVTYTRKAHAELAARIRRSLVESAAYEQAVRLPLAYIGTVHSVCMRLLEELAVDAGMPPHLEVLPDDRGRRIRAAIEESLDVAFVARMDELARRLEISWDTRVARHDWIRYAAEVLALARGNRIPPDALPAMAARSVDSLLALMPPPEADGDALDADLSRELARAIDALATRGDDKNNTQQALRELREVQARLSTGDWRWSDWARAWTCSPSARCRSLVADLTSVAARCVGHPRLHADLRDFTNGLYDAVGVALDGYTRWKAARRVVDYVDMIDRAVTLLERDDIAADLASRLDLVVVDEFQDTSPLQLALFMRLHSLAGRSVWVGDGKQCIFEYAGADPLLMDAVTNWVARQGGDADRLRRNYRSRPALVDACSELFAQAFASHGLSDDEVRTTAARSEAPLASTAPLGVWWLDARNVDEDAIAVAQALRRVLGAPHETTVVDPDDGSARPVRARDIGVLVATNAEAKRIADALYRCGIRSVVARDGVLATPEGTAVDAALRWLVEPRDRLSLATLDALAGFGSLGPDAWLEARLTSCADEIPAWLRPLDALRDHLAVLSPSETLDRVLHALDATTLCARWPDPRQRAGNLEALRALASAYEERCGRHRETATLAGLLRYFAEARTPVLVDDEERATDDQYVGASDDAVTVSTYHRAKGLEWPVVVLASLARAPRRTAFDVSPESDALAFDPEHPLAGRWIRFWPWPFGRREKLPLADSAERSAEGVRVAAREARERLRLLYVGFTRARDHLALAIRQNNQRPAMAWLDELRAASGAPLLTLPVDADDGASTQIFVARATGPALAVPCRVMRVSAATTSGLARREPRRFARPPVAAVDRPSFRIQPSRAHDEPAIPSYAVHRLERISEGLRIRDPAIAWETIGTAVHAFLAADAWDDRTDRRRCNALRALTAYGVDAYIDPDALLEVSDVLGNVVRTRWPTATVEREVSVIVSLETSTGRRRIEGVIDMLVAVDDALVIIDHKTFPVTTDTALVSRAEECAPQLATYAEAVARCGRRVLGCFVHFPVAGAWIEVRRR